MIPIYIASSDRFADIEPVIKYSIEANTDEETFIRIIRPGDIGMRETGCTGFTNIRFAIPHLLGDDGFDFGIYFDVDMLILGDVADLYRFQLDKHYVCLRDGSNEVAVISRNMPMPTIERIGEMKKARLDLLVKKSRKIPPSWNIEDRFEEGANLIHFTDLKTQPWFYDNHPDQKAVELWKHYEKLAKSL